MEIVKENIASAHEAVVKAIIDEGVEKDIEVEPGKWAKTWEYPDPVLIIVRRPQSEPQLSTASNFGPGFIRQYKSDFITIQSNRTAGKDFEYTYADRLFDYPLLTLDNTPSSYHYSGNGRGDGVDQITRLIDKLCVNPESRRALAITWVPLLDSPSTEPPCLQFVHFMIRRGIPAHGENPQLEYLHLRAPFRSHDMLSGYGPNALGLTGLMEYVCSHLNNRLNKNILVGSLTTFSSSAHIYCLAQASELREFKKVLRIS